MASKKTIPKIFQSGLTTVQIVDLPSPVKFSTLIGPGVIMLATAIGSSEVYFWPVVTMKYGFSYIWIALIALYLQYILNTEFARYTLATGETAVTGFARMWKPFAYIFLFSSILLYMWPGWSMGAATVLGWLMPSNFNTEYIAVLILLSIGTALTASKVVYKTVEKLQFAQTIFILLVVIFLSFIFITDRTIASLGIGLMSFPRHIPSEISVAVFATAIAFCGAGGTVNLATSNWIRDKGLGMGGLVSKETNRLTGKLVSKPSPGFFFEGSVGNLINWKKWWRLIRIEQCLTFLLIESISIILLMSLASSLLSNHEIKIGIGIELIQKERSIIDQSGHNWGGILFYLMILFVFLSSSIGVLDHVARISSDIFRNNIKIIRDSNKKVFSISNLYFIMLWGVIIFAILILLGAKITDPRTLLLIAGVLAIYVMLLYSILIFVLHIKLAKQVNKFDIRFINMNPFDMGLWRKIMLIAAVLFYGGLSIIITKSLII